MYLHLGHGAVAPYEAVIGVFDLDNATYAKRTREFLDQAQRQGTLHTLGQRLPLSLVVTDRGSYLSPISAQTLCKRLAENRWE